jgi:hypothetical protein
MTPKRGFAVHGADRYIEGFLCGQALAYCEQIRTGARLVAQLAFDASYERQVLARIRAEGCRVRIERRSGRVSVWIFRRARVERLIRAFSHAPPSVIGLWGMGKLFGYGDREVTEFISANAR